MRTLLVTILASLALASSAQAAIVTHPKLDELASSVAGKPISVQCELDEDAWDAQLRPYGHAGVFVNGYAKWWEAEDKVWISPRRCLALLAAIENKWYDPRFVGPALLTLAHEAIHRTGELDEMVTECRAIGFVAGLATRLGVPQTRSYMAFYTDTRGRKVWRRVTTTNDVPLQMTGEARRSSYCQS